MARSPLRATRSPSPQVGSSDTMARGVSRCWGSIRGRRHNLRVAVSSSSEGSPPPAQRGHGCGRSRGRGRGRPRGSGRSGARDVSTPSRHCLHRRPHHPTWGCTQICRASSSPSCCLTQCLGPGFICRRSSPAPFRGAGPIILR